MRVPALTSPRGVISSEPGPKLRSFSSEGADSKPFSGLFARTALAERAALAARGNANSARAPPVCSPPRCRPENEAGFSCGLRSRARTPVSTRLATGTPRRQPSARVPPKLDFGLLHGCTRRAAARQLPLPTLGRALPYAAGCRRLGARAFVLRAIGPSFRFPALALRAFGLLALVLDVRIFGLRVLACDFGVRGLDFRSIARRGRHVGVRPFADELGAAHAGLGGLHRAPVLGRCGLLRRRAGGRRGCRELRACGAQRGDVAARDVGRREELVVAGGVDRVERAEATQQGRARLRTDAGNRVELGREAPALADHLAAAVREAMG